MLNPKKLTEKLVIEIPTGSTFVLFWYILEKIAEVLEPLPNELPVLCSLQKKSLIDEKHWRFDDLKPADWDLLDDIWHGLSNIRGADTRKFQEYKQAFDMAPNKPEWDLHADFRDLQMQAFNRRIDIRREHFWLMMDAMKSGKLTVLTARHTRATRIEADSIVRVDEAKGYLERIGFELREAVESNVKPTNDKRVTLKQTESTLILNTIRELGHNPLSLPRGIGKKKGAKWDVWNAVSEEFTSRESFNSRWKAMRQDGDIADQS